jgi:hypothetical protein
MADVPGAIVTEDPDDDELEQRIINLNDLCPMEREYFIRLSTIRSLLRLPATGTPIQVIQKIDNT